MKFIVVFFLIVGIICLCIGVTSELKKCPQNSDDCNKTFIIDDVNIDSIFNPILSDKKYIPYNYKDSNFNYPYNNDIIAEDEIIPEDIIPEEIIPEEIIPEEDISDTQLNIPDNQVKIPSTTISLKKNKKNKKSRLPKNIRCKRKLHHYRPNKS